MKKIISIIERLFLVNVYFIRYQVLNEKGVAIQENGIRYSVYKWESPDFPTILEEIKNIRNDNLGITLTSIQKI